MPVPRFAKPKILLMGLAPHIANSLEREGFNLTRGSFGTLYHVEKSDRYFPVIPNGKLPHGFGESDLVVIDLDSEFGPTPDFSDKVTI